MKKFPDPVTLPDSVLQARKKRHRHMIRTVTFGLCIRLMIIAAEGTGAAMFNSASLFMDALASLLDMICSSVLVIFIALAGRPPDEEHPFGHGRYEPLAGLQLGLLLGITGITMLIQQSLKLTTHAAEDTVNPKAWMISFGALILLELGYHITIRVAKKHNSPTLAADAYHYRIDSLTSLLATIALLAAVYLPEWRDTFDHLGALGIAALMIVLGVVAMRKNVRQLLDAAPEPQYFELIRQVAKNTPGVCDTEKLRMQMYGPDAHVDIDIEVDPDLSVEKAHRISQEVRANIQQKLPEVRDVIVHIEPYYPGDH